MIFTTRISSPQLDIRWEIYDDNNNNNCLMSIVNLI